MQKQDVEGFRLSPQQRRVWAQQLHDDPSVYKVQSILLLEGHLDLKAVQAALQQVIQRHGVLLRTKLKISERSKPLSN